MCLAGTDFDSCVESNFLVVRSLTIESAQLSLQLLELEILNNQWKEEEIKFQVLSKVEFVLVIGSSVF